MNESRKVRIAHLAGPTATIQNTPPLVTSNKARAKHGLPSLRDADGAPLRFDALPADGLYWLVEKGSKRLERIFTIEEGMQRWW